MEIIQKKLFNKATFEFGDKTLKYTIKDKHGSRSFSVEYAAIPTDIGEYEERSGGYRNVGLLWMFLGIYIIVMRYLETDELKGSIWFTLGIICLFIYWFAKTQYTNIETEKGTIFIIKNNQHEEIMQEIDIRRKGHLLALYGAPNYDNDPNSEINKYVWLREQEVISKEECEENIRKITEFHNLIINEKDSKENDRTIN